MQSWEPAERKRSGLSKYNAITLGKRPHTFTPQPVLNYFRSVTRLSVGDRTLWRRLRRSPAFIWNERMPNCPFSRPRYAVPTKLARPVSSVNRYFSAFPTCMLYKPVHFPFSSDNVHLVGKPLNDGCIQVRPVRDRTLYQPEWGGGLILTPFCKGSARQSLGGFFLF